MVDGEQTLRFGAAAPVAIAADPLDVAIPLGRGGPGWKRAAP